MPRWLVTKTLLVACAVMTVVGQENSIVGDPVIQCGVDYIALHFRTRSPFRGKVFVKGHFLSPDCQISWNSTNPSSTLQSGGTIWVKHGKCGMHRLRMMNPQGIQFSNVIVVSFHPVFITKMDRAYHVKCDYVESRKSVTFNMDVSPLTVTHVAQSFPLPVCTYTIRKDELDGEILKYAKVDFVLPPLCTVTIFGAYGMLVHSCFVEDGQGKKVLVIDENGCHTDRLLLGDPTYVEALNMAYRESNVFKFADRLAVRFLCQIRLCLKGSGGCDGVTPPSCDSPMISKSEYSSAARLKRQLNHTSKSLQSINADLMSQVLYVLDNDESAYTNSALDRVAASHRNAMCVSPITLGVLLGLIVMTVMLTATLAVAIGCHRRRGQRKPAVAFSSPTFRHLSFRKQ